MLMLKLDTKLDKNIQKEKNYFLCSASNILHCLFYLQMSVQVSLPLLFSLSFPLFLSQVSRTLFDLSTSTFYCLISLLPKFRTIKRNK